MKKAPKEISKPADFTAPGELYDKLIDSVRRYHPSTDISAIEKAYQIADKAHEGQKRKSGEPYIIHPLCVAITLAELELDSGTVTLYKWGAAPSYLVTRLGVDKVGKNSPPPAEKTLWLKLPSKYDPAMRKIELILTMFPGQSQLVIWCEKEKKRIGARCLIHEALVDELSEMLGEENVVIK